MFTNLFKAAVGTILTPVAIVADLVTLPASAFECRETDPFKKTTKMLNQVAKNVDEALK